MAFRTRWTCEHCGHVIWSHTEPDESECTCYKAPEEESAYHEKLMTTIEKKARYKKQYELNGYSWNDKDPEMYYGKFDNYSDKNYLKK